MRILGSVLLAIGFYFYLRTWRVIIHMVEECRASDPSRHFSRLWWLSAWRFHRSRFPESDLRKRMVFQYVLTWLFAGLGFATIVAAQLHGRWLR